MFKQNYKLLWVLALSFALSGLSCNSPSSPQKPKKVYTEEFEFEKPADDKPATGNSANKNTNDHSATATPIGDLAAPYQYVTS
jgi:hypothetical protein